MTPTRSSRRYQYLRAHAYQSGRLDRPMVMFSPEQNQARTAYGYPNQGAPAGYDLRRRLVGNPDQGETLPPS